ncbi:choice-of-anchor I family protein, partial [Methylomagnum sp.]
MLTTPTNALTLTAIGNLALAGAEISGFDPASQRLFVTSNAGLQVVNFSNPAAPALIATLDFTSLGFATTDVTSVAVKNGVVAVALPNADKALNGKVVFLNAADHALLGSVDVGALPDMLSFTPDGKKILVANEGEVVSDANWGGKGSVSIIDITGGVASATVQTAGFTGFDGQEAAHSAARVRLWPGQSVSDDVEPEYIAVSADGGKAMVTLQEANAVAILDIASASFTGIVPLGTKDFSALLADYSDRDGPGNTALINLQTGMPVKGLYMPDAIASYQVGGGTFYVIANEGDDRNDFLDPDESIRVGSGGYDLDNTLFPNEAALKTNAQLGRLTVANAPGLRGDTDGDGDIDQILMYGGRSFSILDASGDRVFDSADIIERIAATLVTTAVFDDRSDNKGPEPEGVTVGVIGGKTYAFVALERAHLSLVFDITDPANVSYTGTAQRAGD